MKLFKLIFKNFRLLTRSKMSSLIIIFGPLLVMFLAGYAFNNDVTFDLQVGVFVPQKTDLTDRFSEELGKKFTLLTYEDNETCVADVRNLKTHACLAFTPDFVIKDGNQNTIAIFVDNSKVNIVDLIQNTLNQVISLESSEISSDLTSVLVVSIDDVSKTLTSWKTTDSAKIKKGLDDLDAALGQDKLILSKHDSSYDKDDNSVSTLKSSASSISSQISNFKSDAKKGIDLIEDFIFDIENLSLGSAALDDLISDTETEISNLEDLIAKHENDTATSAELSDSISKVSDLVSSLQKKIDSTAALKSEFGNKYDGYSTRISDIKKSVTALESKYDVLNSQLTGIQIKDTSSIVDPVVSQIVPVVTSTSKLNYIFPSLMILVIMFVCIMLSATIVVMEKLSPAKFRIFTTPTTDIHFISSIFFTVLFVALFQIIVLLLIGAFVFDLPITDNLFNSILILFIASVIFTLIGMSLGYIFSNEQTTILGAISVGSAFLLVSDIILPIESIGEQMRSVILYTPFVMVTNLLRRTLIFDAELADLGMPFAVSILYCVGLFLIIVIAHKLLKLVFLFNNTKKRK